MSKKSTKQVNSGKLPKLWELLVYYHLNEPDAFDNPSELRRRVALKWRALNDEKHCPNCGESMTEYIHKLDFFNALLLKHMGDIVKKRLNGGMYFNQANRVHVVSQNFHDCIRHRTSQCRTLGLIAKVEKADGKHDREAGWLITKRGFAALRGEKIPAEVSVFRNKIEERTEKMTTLDEVFEQYSGENKDLIGERDPMEWVNFGNIHNSTML